MKTLMISLIIVSTLSTEWLTNITTAKEAAAKENKYILLNFSGSDWCAPCIKMKKEVFENEAFLNLAEKHLILVRVDFPRGKKNKLSDDQTKHNEALAEKYNPSGKFPLTVLLAANGKVIKEWDGYAFSSQDKFIADLGTALAAR